VKGFGLGWIWRGLCRVACYVIAVSVCIDLFCKNTSGLNTKVGSGTEFFRRYKSELFLI